MDGWMDKLSKKLFQYIERKSYNFSISINLVSIKPINLP